MSIIYDALKKIGSEKKVLRQEIGSVEKKQTGNAYQGSRIKQILITFVFLTILSLIALFVDSPSDKKAPIDSGLIKKRSKKVTAVKKLSPAKEKSPARIKLLSGSEENSDFLLRKLPSFYLTGTFYSDGGHVALINDRMVKAGDSIDEIKIIAVDAKGVEIEFKDSTFRLSYP